MSTNIKIIKNLLLMTLIMVVATYLVHLNIEFVVVTLNSKWISNNLLFTIFCSIFTALFVSLLSEARQYRLNKQGCLHYLFFQLASMYGQLIQMQHSMKKWMVNQDKMVSSAGLNESASACRVHIENISQVDYSVWKFFWSKGDKFENDFNQFKFSDCMLVKNFLLSISHLDIAISTDQINNLENQMNNEETIKAQRNPTFGSHYTGKVITRLDKDIVPVILLINRMLEDVDTECNNKYNWSSTRDKMQMALNNMEEVSMEKFVGENN